MKLKALFAGLAMIVSSNIYAADIGVGVKAGTLGFGVDISMALTQTINARFSLSKFSRDINETLNINDANNTATIDSTLNVDFGSAAILFDWYVFDGTFHLTGGFLKNSSSIDLNGRITDANVIFNGTSYNVVTEFQDPNLSASISFGNSLQPYLGIGWGRKADDDPGLSVSLELGVVLLDPSVDLKAPVISGTSTSTQAQIDADVNAAEAAANDELSVLEAWPVISLGLNYAF